MVFDRYRDLIFLSGYPSLGALDRYRHLLCYHFFLMI